MRDTRRLSTSSSSSITSSTSWPETGAPLLFSGVPWSTTGADSTTQFSTAGPVSPGPLPDHTSDRGWRQRCLWDSSESWRCILARPASPRRARAPCVEASSSSSTSWCSQSPSFSSGSGDWVRSREFDVRESREALTAERLWFSVEDRKRFVTLSK